MKLVKEVKSQLPREANEFQKLQQELQEKYLKTLHGKGISIRQLVRKTGLTKAKIGRRLL